MILWKSGKVSSCTQYSSWMHEYVRDYLMMVLMLTVLRDCKMCSMTFLAHLRAWTPNSCNRILSRLLWISGISSVLWYNCHEYWTQHLPFICIICWRSQWKKIVTLTMTLHPLVPSDNWCRNRTPTSMFLLSSLHSLLSDPSVMDQVEQSQNWVRTGGIMEDICDGMLIKEHPLFPVIHLPYS